MQLSTSELLRTYTKEQVKASTYKILTRTYIRLINTNPEEAHIPALIDNVKENKEYLEQYDNVTKRRKDKLNSETRHNTKIDLDITQEVTVILGDNK